MARNDHSEDFGADEPPTKDLTDDVKRLLDQLAGQITEADQRHTDTVQDMQTRLTTLSDRAAAAKPDQPEDTAEAFGRVEAAMAALANRLSAAEPVAPRVEPAEKEPATVLPEEVRADLRRAIAEGHREARHAAPAPTTVPAEKPPASRYPYVGPHVATASGTEPATPPSPPAAPAIERAWLEDRFADIADRVEKSMSRLDRHNSFEAITARFDQFEQRFAVALDAKPARGSIDASALQGIERQITGLFAELDRTRTQLGRLDTIESRLTELRGAPSDAQQAHPINSAAPTDAQLSAVAMAAAECVAERIRDMAPAGAAQADATGSDSRLSDLIAIMQAFIGEHRTGDAQTAEALDTMQQAMQHLIDRVEAIEAAQIAGHDELMRAARESQPSRAAVQNEPLDFGFREQDLRPTPGAVGPEQLPSIAVAGPAPANAVTSATPPAIPASQGIHIHPEPRGPQPAQDRDDDDALRLAVAHDDRTHVAPAARPLHAPPQGAGAADAPHREAFIAMARRAAEKATREPAPQPDAVKAGRVAGALGWARKFTAPAMAGGDSNQARRPRILLVASFAAFLLAGFWMLAGSGLRGMIPIIGSAQPVSPTKPTGMNSDAPVENATGRVAATLQPSGDSRFPGMGRVVDGGVGITIDEGSGRAPPTLTLKAPEQVQLASLTAPAAQDEGRKATATPEAPVRSSPVEMPSAHIGPLSLRHAAANGDPVAQFEVASRFAEAKGVPQDFAQAATWYQRAATQGLANAQYRLGALYERGLGVAADPARARVWYGRAAEQGNVRAMHNLAVFSAGRPGTNPDYPSAVQWFTEAANHGLADSQYNLGILYESGLGVPASAVEAYKWYALAARFGDKDAIRRRDNLRAKLDPASVSAVDALVIRWRARPLDPVANDMRGTAPAAQIAR
jgi:localization factor PodJL